MMPIKVLYLEDSASDLDLTRRHLERAAPGGFDITTAGTLKEARDHLRQAAFDVVLADLNVPDSKGIATITGLLAAGCQVPILAFTGELDPERGIEAVNAGAADFVTKGLTDTTTLANRIRFAIARGAPPSPNVALAAVAVERTAGVNAALRELQASHEELTRQKALMDAFMQELPYCCFLQDAHTGHLEFVSPAYERIFHRSLADLKANPLDWVSLVHPEDREAIVQQFKDTQSNPEGAAESEFRIVDPGGGQRWIRVTWMTVGGTPGNVAHRAGVLADVTQEKDQESLRQTATQREQDLAVSRRSEEFKANFLNMAAHDLSTPITPLRLQVASMRFKARAKGDLEFLGAIDLLDRNLLRLTGLVQDILDVARIQAGRIQFRPRDVDLQDAVRDSLATIQGLAKVGGVDLASRLGPVPMTVDLDRLAQILLNLVSNAVKYTPKGGHVEVDLTADATQATITVKDDGRGIDPADLPKLFRPFSRVGDTAAVQGTGLGLMISQSLARQMGGDIRLESAGLGKGALATFMVPLRPPVPAPPPGPATGGVPAA